METILTKTSKTGMLIEIKASRSSAFLFLDGQEVKGGTTAPILLEKPQGDVTHYMGGAAGKVGLTSAEAKSIKAAIAGPKLPRVDPATTWMGDASMDAENSIF